MLGGVSYDKVDDDGLHITVDGEARLLEVDNVIVCAGQEPLKDLEVRFVLGCSALSTKIVAIIVARGAPELFAIKTAQYKPCPSSKPSVRNVVESLTSLECVWVNAVAGATQ